MLTLTLVSTSVESTAVDKFSRTAQITRMSKAEQTKGALLNEARRRFWTRGYSNVSLREIAGAVGVDVAMVSRYFGSKRGLFEATMDELPVLDIAVLPDPDSLIDWVVTMFVEAPRRPDLPSPTGMILINANDPEVGEAVRASYASCWHAPLVKILGSAERASAFSAAMLGMSVAEKTLRLDGFAAPTSPAYRTRLEETLRAAVNQ